MEKLFKIDSDCLDIVSRIKAIDKDYFLVYNEENQKFEVHNSSQTKHTLCLILPFDVLDERTIDLVLKTRVQNADKLFKEMEEENKKLEKAKIKQVLNDFEEKFYDS